MKFTTLIAHSAQLLKIILKSPAPADRLASEYLRKKKYIGSNDRKFISGFVFLVQRLWLSAVSAIAATIPDIEAAIKQDAPNASQLQGHSHELLLIMSAVAASNNHNLSFPSISKSTEFDIQDFIEAMTELLECPARGLQSILDTLDNYYYDLAERCQSQEASVSDLSNYYSIPHYFIEQLSLTIKDPAQLSSILMSLLHPASPGLRVNLSLSSTEKVIAVLGKNNITASAHSLVPSAISIEGRPNLNASPLYKAGIIDVQDPGSQLICYAAAPQANDYILDACAGAGGKSLMLAMLQQDHGNILSTDIEYKRLSEIPSRSRRFGYRSISTKLLGHSSKKRGDDLEEASFDIVLVDAPCSGSGTVRRLPQQKYKITEEYIRKISANQIAILNYYSKYLKPGGVLLYATCSMLPAENQDVVSHFLGENDDFIPSALAPALARFDVELPDLGPDEYMYNLYPATHGTDGFFFARMQRC